MMGSMAVHRYSWETTGTWICFLLTSLYGACLSDSTDQCTTTLTASEGYITSPGYPSNHMNKLNCTYVITGDGNAQNITIDLVDLDLELVSNCPYDWLIVDGGPKLCNHTTFHKTYVFQNRFVITFISDGSNTGRGFKMRYSIGVDDTCFSTHFMTSGRISTTNKCTSNCTNTIVGNGKLQTLSLDFVSLNFTTSPNCDAGWLTIDGGPKICTSTPFKTKYAFFGSVDIVTHGGDSCGGFVVNYALQDNCKATFTASEGIINSTGYTGLHTNYLSCTYVIMGAGQAQIISIDMLEMDLEETSDCRSNWLIIDDGPKLCKHTTFHKKYVIQDRFIIMFGNDYSSSNRRSFKMHYSVGGVDSNDNCTSNHLTTSGQISTPCSSCNCTYNSCTNTIIGSGKQQTLSLDFHSLNFTTSPNCDAGWFTIDGGPKICTPTPFTSIYTFSGSIDIVTHGGDRSVDPCPGFVVNYAVQDNCTTTLTDSEGYITSPGYPGNYMNNLDCMYAIVGDGHTQIITIDLLELDLRSCYSCKCDWLMIDDGPKLCNPITFHKTFAFRDRFIIKFRTDSSYTGGGFKMRYSVGMDPNDTCTSIHTKTYGQMSTPCSSCNYTYNNCTNTIIGSGKLQTITLDFGSLNFTTSPYCDAGWFTIDGGPKMCTSTPFTTIYAFFGSLDIVTHGGDRSGGFVANYAVQDNCTTTLTASEGEITSPGYPGIPNDLVSCTYVIVGDILTQIITIDLLELDLNYCSGAGYYCICDWLIIDDGPLLCYPTTFHKIYVFRNRFIIKFRTYYGSSSRGFKMHYSVGMDANDNCTYTHTKTSGQISTPCSSCNCTFNNCTNTIVGSGKLQTLSLDFIFLNFITASANCDAGWFTIDDGPRICTSTPFKTTYAFFGSVDIVTHGGVNSGGFVVNYAVEDNHTTTLTSNEGEITSPGYPGIHTNYLSCTYVIVGDGHTQSIVIDLLEIDLYEGPACNNDWLIIGDGPQLCSPTTFHKTYAFQDRFIITFRTDYDTSSRGFKMHYSVGMDANDTCTSTHLKTSGQISTPCSSCNCTYRNCTNTIIGSGKLQTLTLDFVSLNFTNSANCDIGWLTIDGGPQICTAKPFKTTYAFFGSVDIVIHGGDRSVDTCGGFVVNYGVQDVVNNILTYNTNSGQLIGPSFPGTYSYSLVESTYIIVGHFTPQKITLDIALTTYSSDSCNDNRLTLNSTEDLCYPGTYNRTYLSQNDFTIRFAGRLGSTFLIHYEKEDNLEGKTLV